MPLDSTRLASPQLKIENTSSLLLKFERKGAGAGASETTPYDTWGRNSVVRASHRCLYIDWRSEHCKG